MILNPFQKYESDEECLQEKESFKHHCDKLDQSLDELESIQTAILKLFLTSNDAEGPQGGATSQFIFLSKIREYAREIVVTRVNFPHMVYLFPLSDALHLFQRLLVLVHEELGRGSGSGTDEEASGAASSTTEGQFIIEKGHNFGFHKIVCVIID